MKVYNDITEIYGNTPLVRLNRMMDGAAATVYAKLEFYNPTSTVKDRLAIAMVDAAEKSGALKPGGTITGVGQYLREKNPDIKIFAVEPFASPILNGGAPGGHPIQGIGPNFIPQVLDTKIYNEVLDATADDAVKYARRAATEEGILAGISSGAALWATSEIAKRPEFAGKTIVVIIPSFGERYLSTILYQDLMDA